MPPPQAASRDPQAASLPQQAPRRRSIPRRIGRWLWNALAVTGLIFIIYHACFEVSMVSSGSMAPTLAGEGQPGSDWLLSERVSYWFRNPRRWEVVQFVNPDHLLVAKRVVGLPGETVSLQDHQVTINGQLAPRPHALDAIWYLACGRLHRGKSAPCGDGYFVLGDDTKDSQDSRWEGPVAPTEIRSRVWLRIWPPARIGFVNP
jgi:signal peptidase I